ncbi:natriuretic peptide receptor 2 [Platysternon megacephalum]|uniref:Natriuretic peptide receptor 2 n=1 Tax=Platysternon megacephalum TaxID=55544 RepID=A0A4D9DR58_9SAUR|nr:natriuretic peptide receptor 2 [Platysternon megacephalum]
MMSSLPHGTSRPTAPLQRPLEAQSALDARDVPGAPHPTGRSLWFATCPELPAICPSSTAPAS